MEIKFFKIKKSFQKKNSFLNEPSFYWRSAILLVALVAIFVFFFGFRLFKQIEQGPVLPENSGTSQVETVKKDELDKSVEYFSARDKQTTAIINLSSPVIDPSL